MGTASALRRPQPRRAGSASRTMPPTTAMMPRTGGTDTPSRSSVVTLTGPASKTVSRSVQNTPPYSNATTPATTSTTPTIRLTVMTVLQQASGVTHQTTDRRTTVPSANQRTAVPSGKPDSSRPDSSQSDSSQ